MPCGIGVPHEVSRQEAEESTQGRFAKTRSRSVLGSMNDFAFQLEFVFRSREDPTLAALSPTSARIRSLRPAWP